MAPSGSLRPGADAARVEATVAGKLAPSPEFLARVARARDELVIRAGAVARERSSPMVRAIVAGSAARGTFLRDRLDIDLFLLFPPDLPRERLREEGLGIGRALLAETETRYAEHPYLRGTFEGFRVDAVPGFAVSDPSHPLSPVDRTPFHQEYLASRETPQLVGEVRLAKQFLRTLGVYGSEARTEGFSGYLVELLVLRSGSFHQFVEDVRGWRIPARLTPPAHEPPRLPEDVALVLADPVDPHRNVASALSRRNLGLLIAAARLYLEEPSEAWFEPRPEPPISKSEALRRVHDRASHVTIVTLPRPDLVDDTLYPQVRKADRVMAEELARLGFELLGSASAVDATTVVIALEVAHRDRSAVRRRDGPPAGIDRVGEFLDKWSAADAPVLQGPYVRDDGSLAVETHERSREVEAVLRARLPQLSLGKNLTPGESASAYVRSLGDSPDSSALTEALGRLLGKHLPWAPRREPPISRD